MLSVDANRDGLIDSSGAGAAGAAFSFGPNLNDDAPGQTAEADYINNHVDGAADLKDFVPVFLDLKQYLAAFPPSGGATYKLKQADGALNFVYTNLKRETAFTYATSTTPDVYGPALNQPAAVALTQRITADGIDLFAGSPAFLTSVQERNGGVILLEGRQFSNQPLVLEIKQGGTVLLTVNLAMQISIGSLAVDANRDGTIKLASEDDSDRTSSVKPYRFWLNDDNDDGAIGGADIPGGYDYLTNDITGEGVVRGTRDLIDLFPVYLDIKQLLTVLPPSASVKYKLKQADSAVNFVYTNLTRDHAFDYQRPQAGAAPLETGFGVNLVQAPQEASKFQVTAAGFDLFRDTFGGSPAFLDAIQNHNGGVILVEGRSASDKPLVLSVERTDGTVIAEVKLEIKISSVETMFRHLNLRDGASAASGLLGNQRDTGSATRLGNPVDAFPDTSADQPWFIFVVGSNVGGQSARGWESETFKRLYWSKSNARFLGVSWFGDPYANGSDGVYDYHLAVRNAFATAPALASAVNGLSGTGSKTIAGHSLACGLISAALSDHSMNVAHATLIDAAIAREVFDGRVGSGDRLSDEESGMTPVIWRNYDLRLQSPYWHERFASVSGDSRQTLTWRNRFLAAVPKIHSFYSSTEDALGSYTGDVPTTSLGAAAVVIYNGAAFTAYVWVYQEKAKGNRQDYYLPVLGSFHGGSTYMGWGMNLKDPVLSGDPTHWKWVSTPDYIGRMIKTSTEIGNVSDSVLRRHPVFEPGWGVVKNQEQQENPVSNVSPVDGAPSWIYDLYGATSGSSLVGVATSVNRSQLLAEAIPAQSLPVGANETTALEDRNYNLPVRFADPGWPRSIKNGVREWRHSDLREIAYLYQSRFWDTLVSISQQP